MSIPLSSPHVHSQYCDGKSTAEEMVQAAIERGFVSLGISSHATQDFDPGYCMDAAKEEAYIREIRALRQRYENQIRLWLGIERDAYSNADPAKYDYVIASAHYLRPDGDTFSVDGDLGQLRAGIDRHYHGSGGAMATAYYALLGSYVRRSRPDIIGHFDLVMKHNRQGELYDPDEPMVMRAALAAMEEAFEGCRLMEVNTGALARSAARAPYPSLTLLKHWRGLGGEVILSSDCHSAHQIDAGYEEGLRLMREAGYDRMQYLGTAERLFETTAI